jgi:hypothetical protein
MCSRGTPVAAGKRLRHRGGAVLQVLFCDHCHQSAGSHSRSSPRSGCAHATVRILRHLSDPPTSALMGWPARRPVRPRGLRRALCRRRVFASRPIAALPLRSDEASVRYRRAAGITGGQAERARRHYRRKHLVHPHHRDCPARLRGDCRAQHARHRRIRATPGTRRAPAPEPPGASCCAWCASSRPSCSGLPSWGAGSSPP